MSFRRSMEQLRPARTQKIDLQEKVQQLFLTEAASTASTLFEGVIADCANAPKSKASFEKQILNKPYIKNFLPLADKMSGAAGKTAFATKGKTNKEYLQKFFDYFFRQIELSIREIGYGDVSINKKMKDYINIFFSILDKINDW